MATLQEVLQHTTGHTNGRPQQIEWRAHFTPVVMSRDGTSLASTHVDFSSAYGYSSRADADGKHRLTNVRVTVTMNRARSWFVRGREGPLLLRHEQGHYNITFSAARDLCRKLLDVEWDAAVLEALEKSSPARIMAQLRNEADALLRTARAESSRLNELYDDPARGAKNADGSINPDTQGRWDRMVEHAIQQDTSLSLLIEIAGGNPRNW